MPEVLATLGPCCGILRRGMNEPNVMHNGLCREKHDGCLGQTIYLVDAAEVERLRAELVECRAKHMDDLLVLGETAKAERELRAELAGMTDHRRAYMERAERWEASCSRAVAELAECKLSLAAIHAMAHRVSAWTIQRECERAVPELAALAAKEEG